MDAAIAAARRAFDETGWAADHAFRVRCLQQLQEALTKNADELRATLVAEVGTPVSLTHGPQLDTPVEGLGWVADLAEGYEWEQDLGEAARFGGRSAAHAGARARRRGRGDHAVELPDADQPGQGRPGAGGRLAPPC